MFGAEIAGLGSEEEILHSLVQPLLNNKLQNPDRKFPKPEHIHMCDDGIDFYWGKVHLWLKSPDGF